MEFRATNREAQWNMKKRVCLGFSLLLLFLCPDLGSSLVMWQHWRKHNFKKRSNSVIIFINVYKWFPCLVMVWCTMWLKIEEMLLFFLFGVWTSLEKCDFWKTAGHRRAGKNLVILDLPKLCSDIFIDLTFTQPFFFLGLQPPYLKCVKEDWGIRRNCRWESEI